MFADQERETCVPCPHCNGRGHHIVEEGTSYRRVTCDLCAGTTVVTASAMRAWKESKR
jgi:DnaJ-class molecular chaperone